MCYLVFAFVIVPMQKENDNSKGIVIKIADNRLGTISAEDIEEMLNELPPSLKLDLGSFKITSGGFDLYTEKTQINEQTGLKENVKAMPTYDNLRDEIDNRHQHAAQLQAQAKELFQYNEKVFEVHPDSIEAHHAKLRYEHEPGKEQDLEIER